FAEWNRRADRWARRLAADGVEPGDLVALLLERSTAMAVAIYAVLKAGCAYLPIDPDYPESRVGYLLEDSGARCVLTTGALRDRVGSFSGRVRLMEQPPEDAPADVVSRNPAPEPALAYVMYTS